MFAYVVLVFARTRETFVWGLCGGLKRATGAMTVAKARPVVRSMPNAGRRPSVPRSTATDCAGSRPEPCWAMTDRGRHLVAETSFGTGRHASPLHLAWLGGVRGMLNVQSDAQAHSLHPHTWPTTPLSTCEKGTAPWQRTGGKEISGKAHIPPWRSLR